MEAHVVFVVVLPESTIVLVCVCVDTEIIRWQSAARASPVVDDGGWSALLDFFLRALPQKVFQRCAIIQS